MENDDPIVSEIRTVRARNNAVAGYDVAEVARRAYEAVKSLGLQFSSLKPVPKTTCGLAVPTR